MENVKLFAVTDSGKKIPFSCIREGGLLVFTLKKEDYAGAASLRIGEDLTRARVGDGGWYVLPRNIRNVADIITRFSEREDGSYQINRPLMSLFGLKKPGLCALVRIRRDFEYILEVTKAGDEYTLAVLLDFTGDDYPGDVRIEVLPLDGNAGYADMAAAERELRAARGEITTLREKCELPAVEYARKYPVVRIRMGWKPSPSDVLEQTPENEPEMHVACTFARVRELADEFKRQGVPGVDIQLVGWNKSGHDGCYPQLFPVEPKLGGEEELRRTVEYVKSLGYRISLHTNNIDCCTLADCFTWDDVSRHRDGSVMQVGHYSGGLAYRVCPERQLKNAMRDLPRVAALGVNGLHYVDVMSIVTPDPCHTPEHPMTVGEGVTVIQKTIAYVRGLFGGFSSEGCMDFAMKYLDHGLYTTFGDSLRVTRSHLYDEFVPMFELAYHGITLYNPDSSTVNYTIKPPADQLKMIMRGGHPSFYFYSKFRTNGAKDWMGEVDLSCDGEEDMRRSVAAVARACREYEQFADRQFVYMTNYEKRGDGVETAIYADGVRVVGNFSNEEKEFEGRTLPPYGYAVI